MNTTVDYSQIEVSFDQTDIERASRGSQPIEGWYKFLVTNAKAAVSKNKGSMMYELDCSMTDVDGNTRGKPVRNWLVLPISTNKKLLEAAGFPPEFKHTAPNTSGLVRSYLEATRPTEFPHDLTFNKAEKQFYYKGATATKKEVEEIKTASANAVLSFVTNAWKDASKTFVGDTFYGYLTYREGQDRPSIGQVRNELPEGETLVAI